jgi:polyisoprenoid-binding protein YceI
MLNSESSVIKYEAKHLLHKWEGINEKIKGVFLSKIAVAANISDFDTGISNRDSNTLRVLNALEYPQVKFYSDKILISENVISFEGELDFHGVKIKKNIEANYFIKNSSINIEGNFPIQLTDFDIKLPSLMLVKMDNIANIKYKLIFEMNK